MIVNLLLQNGADVNIRTKKGETVLHYAIWLGREDLASVIVKAGARLDIRENMKNYTPLQLAIKEHAEGIAKYLRRVEGN